MNIMTGRVKTFFHDKGFGFIKGEDGNDYFVHTAYLQGEYLNRNYLVQFKPHKTKSGKLCAENVFVIEATEPRRQHK